MNYAIGVSVAAVTLAVAWRSGALPADPRRSVGTAVLVGACVAVLAAGVARNVGQTRDFARLGLKEAGTVRPGERPLPSALVAATRRTLAQGATWSLLTPDGSCREDSYRFFWLAFLLYPRVPDCDSPHYVIVWRVTDVPDGSVVAHGQSFVIVQR